MKETEEEGEIETDRYKDRQIYKQRVVEREREAEIGVSERDIDR